MALVLGFFKIKEFRKKKVSLKINLSQVEFSSMQNDHSSGIWPETSIQIGVYLKNSGLEPTTLTGVDFSSDNKSLKFKKMSRVYHENDFAPIRIEANDSMDICLSILEYIYLPENITEINTKLVFKTTHKDISKKIKLKR